MCEPTVCKNPVRPPKTPEQLLKEAEQAKAERAKKKQSGSDWQDEHIR